MYITILGAGNGGSAMAADLADKGHHITLMKTSTKGNMEHFEHIQQHDGLIEIIQDNISKKVHLDKVTTDFAEGLRAETELIIIFMPTTFHETLIKKIIPFLHDGQIILLEPGYLSTCYFIKYAPHLDLTIAEAQSSPLDCRIIAPGVVKISFANFCNPIGIYPNSSKFHIFEDLDCHFKKLDNTIEAALHNPNLIVHTIGGIMSIPRIEYSHGDYWMYKEVFTPSIWNLIDQLDAEKMEILAALGFEKLSYLEACKIRNSVANSTTPAIDIFNEYAEYESIKGPLVSNSRYITEDVPEGLVLLESLGQFCHIPTPICTSLINIASATLATDFRTQGRTIQKLGLKQLQLILQLK